MSEDDPRFHISSVSSELSNSDFHSVTAIIKDIQDQTVGFI